MTASPSDVTWREFLDAAPELGQLVAARLAASEHHVIATLRADGSPRVNGTNVVLDGDDLLVGCMPGTRRAADLRRDPRCALHAGPDLSTLPEGDARLECTAELVDPERTRAVFRRLAETDDVQQDGEPLDGDLFALRVRSASTVQVAGDVLTVTIWTPGQGVRVVDRS